MNKALFFDRDGVLIKHIFDVHTGLIDTPRQIKQIEFVPGIFELLKEVKINGYLTVLISNQPAIGLKKISKTNFIETEKYIVRHLSNEKISLDGIYYCFHHPYAKINRYKRVCSCRKPKPGLIILASRKLRIDVDKSFFIGDSIYDVRAGHDAGCRTILLANLMESSEFFRILYEKLGNIRPDYIVKNLLEAKKILA